MLVERKVDGSKGPKRHVIRNQNQTANFIKWFDGSITPPHNKWAYREASYGRHNCTTKGFRLIKVKIELKTILKNSYDLPYFLIAVHKHNMPILIMRLNFAPPCFHLIFTRLYT